MSRGILLFAHNNAMVDYVQLAVMCAALIRRNMPGIDICLVTDTPSLHVHEGKGRWPLERFFSQVLINDFDAEFENSRSYRDTRYYSVDVEFRNEDRPLAYELSPYDETLLLDTDYLVLGNHLGSVWGNPEDLLIGDAAIDLLHQPLPGADHRVNPFGIKLRWAGAVFFRKSAKAKQAFDLVRHVKDSWDFYKLTYDLPGRLYRNDFAFAIALHVLGGFAEDSMFVPGLPEGAMLTALDIDQFYKLHSPTEATFFVQDRAEPWKFYASRLKGVNVHCMNKLSLLNNMEQIMGVLGE